MAYDASATGEHVRHIPSVQSYTLSIPMQIRVVMHRLKGDWATQAVQVGSVFHRIDSACVLEAHLS